MVFSEKYNVSKCQTCKCSLSNISPIDPLVNWSIEIVSVLKKQ